MPQSFIPQNAQRLRIYISESDQWRSRSLHSVLLQTFKEQGIAGATILRGMAGFGAHSRLQSTAVEVLSMDLPMIIEAIDSPEKITTVLEIINPMIREGLITLEDVKLIKYTHRYANLLPADKYVSECMTREVITLSPEMNVGTAWQIMLKHALKAIPVVDQTGAVVGILTDEDLLTRAGIQQRLSMALRLPDTHMADEIAKRSASPITINQIMSHPVKTIRENETLDRAVSMMIKAGLKRLPVIDQEKKLVGILSRLDILQQVANSPLMETKPITTNGNLKTIADIMRKDIPLVDQSANLSTIIDKMIQSNTHRLIVVNEQGIATGLISDSDLIARVQPSKHHPIINAFLRKSAPPPGKETAFELMSPEPLSALPNLAIIDAVKLMLSHSRKWLVVLDENQRPLGLVDRQSLLLSLDPQSITSKIE